MRIHCTGNRKRKCIHTLDLCLRLVGLYEAPADGVDGEDDLLIKKFLNPAMFSFGLLVLSKTKLKDLRELFSENPKLLGLGRQIGPKFLGAIGFFTYRGVR